MDSSDGAIRTSARALLNHLYDRGSPETMDDTGEGEPPKVIESAMMFQNEPLSEVLRGVAHSTNFSIVVDGNVLNDDKSSGITARISKLDVRSSLNHVLR